MSVKTILSLPDLSFTKKIKRLPRKQKKKFKKFEAESEAILATAEASLLDFGGYIEDVIELDNMKR